MRHAAGDLSKAGAIGVNVQNAEEAAKRLSDKRAPAVSTDGQSARRVRGREPGNRALPSPPAPLDVVGRRRRFIDRRQREHPCLGRLADQKEPGVWSEDTDDVRFGLDEFVDRRKQVARVHVHCINTLARFFRTFRKSLNTSQALNTGRVSNTSRGPDLTVLIEAGPQIQEGFHGFIHTARAYMLPAISCLNFAVIYTTLFAKWQKCGCTNTSLAWNKSQTSITSRG